MFGNKRDWEHGQFSDSSSFNCSKLLVSISMVSCLFCSVQFLQLCVIVSFLQQGHTSCNSRLRSKSSPASR